jgi:hypothetical protein
LLEQAANTTDDYYVTIGEKVHRQWQQMMAE